MNKMTKLYSPACTRNAAPILQAITPFLQNSKTILEIGSGTGQHAVHFSQHLPHLHWQTSDRAENHPSIQAWVEEAQLDNLALPFELDVASADWPNVLYDAIFTANTCHIMAWSEVEMMFAGAEKILNSGGVFLIYGPFNYQGQFTSASNAQFDASLKLDVPHRGIRDIEAMMALAQKHQLLLTEDGEMPANNRLLAFQKQ